MAVEPCDMRKGFQGLIVAAVEHLNQALDRDATAEQAAELPPARIAAALRTEAQEVA